MLFFFSFFSLFCFVRSFVLPCFALKYGAIAYSAAICCVSLVNIAYTPRLPTVNAATGCSMELWSGRGGVLVVLPCWLHKCRSIQPTRQAASQAAHTHALRAISSRRVVSSRNFRTSVGNIKIATKYKSNLCAPFSISFRCMHMHAAIPLPLFL